MARTRGSSKPMTGANAGHLTSGPARPGSEVVSLVSGSWRSLGHLDENRAGRARRVLWQRSLVAQRYDAVMEVVCDGPPVSLVAERYGVVRQSVDAWLHRYRPKAWTGWPTHRTGWPPVGWPVRLSRRCGTSVDGHPLVADAGMVHVAAKEAAVWWPPSRCCCPGRQHLAAHQVPALVAFLDRLRGDSVGKAAVGQLRALISSHPTWGAASPPVVP
jgi:hypothetical protein